MLNTAPFDDAEDRRQGALLGLAIGDALGTTLEFSKPPAQPWHPPLAGPLTTISGGGPFHVDRGQVTDDTHMACCLARVLAARPMPTEVGKLLALEYQAWEPRAFDSGRQTAEAIQRMAFGVDPTLAGYQVWAEGGRRAAGNGSLMRTAPIGALIPDREERLRVAVLDSLLTHADPRCVLACAGFTEAIAAGISGGGINAMVQAAEAAVTAGITVALRQPAGPLITGDEWRSACDDLHLDLLAARMDDPWLLDEESMPPAWDLLVASRGPIDPERARLALNGDMAGFVRVAFRLAFWQLLHARDVRSALVDTVNRGFDADTNGAIVGALLGAHWGYESLPRDWVEAVLQANPAKPWHHEGLYHPRWLRRGAAPASNHAGGCA